MAAARDLYADGRAAFRHVTLPLTMPGIIAAALLTFIPSIGDFVTPDLLGGVQTITIAKVIQILFMSPGLAVRRRPRLPAHRRHDRGNPGIPPHPAARGDRLMRRDRNRGLTLFSLIVYAFLFAPIVILIIFSFNDAKDVFAWRGFTLKSYPELFGDRNLMKGLSVSFQVAAIAVVATTILGTLLGLGLARLRSRSGAAAADTLILLPMVTPEVVMGISLLLFFALVFNANGSSSRSPSPTSPSRSRTWRSSSAPGPCPWIRGWRRPPAISGPRP